jgi:hypothetical protein
MLVWFQASNTWPFEVSLTEDLPTGTVAPPAADVEGLDRRATGLIQQMENRKTLLVKIKDTPKYNSLPTSSPEAHLLATGSPDTISSKKSAP